MPKKNDDLHFNYVLNDDGQFTIQNYTHAPAFASFMPGIAGVYGIPMWVFYVNRGQGIAGFGIDTKDQAIVEFQSANRAYQLTPTVGYRTFIKVDGKDVFEAFKKPTISESDRVKQKMNISSYGLGLVEENAEKGIKTEVSYFTVPNEPVAAFGRKVTVTNTSGKAMDIELVDGLPQIVNYGLNNWLLKNMTYLTEAWAFIENVENRAPMYKIKIAVNDSPEVEFVHSANFYVSKAFGSKELAPVIIDPKLIFGEDEAFISAERFINSDKFEIPAEQCNQKTSPCGFSYFKKTLKPSESFTFVSFAGNVRTVEYLNGFVDKLKAVEAYTAAKEGENRQIIEQIQDDVFTVSGNKNFDFYTRQNYLDNVLRGGLPYQLGTEKTRALFYLYSRKHGDMERDYNHYKIAPTYFSQGNGNYRDVNQNRRNDVLINPFVEDSGIRTFLNLIQLDGNNPLVVFGAKFFIEDEVKLTEFLNRTVKNPSTKLKTLLNHGYTPGDVLQVIEDEKLTLKVERESFIADAVSLSERFENADHNEGFWTDHWTYNTDLIESYLAVYPEKEKELFFGDRSFTFYDTFCRVAPRSEKYFLTPNGVRQFSSVLEDKDRHKKLGQRKKNPHAVRTHYGEGDIYRTNLFAKLIVLVLNKAANLDPSGVGIEMESNKPNWYDALNSLPGLFGSSSCETFEVKRLLLVMKNVVKNLKLSHSDTFIVPVEVASFMEELTRAFREKDSYAQWDARCTAKEAYRAKTFTGIDGAETSITTDSFVAFADLVLATIEEGIKKGIDKKSGLPFSYFAHEVTEYEKTGEEKNGMPLVRAKSFKMRPLPLFLEGIVHAMRSEVDPARVKKIHEETVKSDLFDKKLKMFKVNASLEKEGYEIGRNRAFPAGWLENESIWLHMEYKYLLELARKGLYNEFFQTAMDTLIYNLDPKVYGRSILENSSFICSSAYYDSSKHGQGFYARLSGSTAEFIHMWLFMVAGQAPFGTDSNGNLTLTFAPAIPGEYFTTKAEKVPSYDVNSKLTTLEVPANSFAFKLLGRVPVVYTNPGRIDTWSPKAKIAVVKIYGLDGKLAYECSGPVVNGEWAQKVRDRAVARIEVTIQG